MKNILPLASLLALAGTLQAQGVALSTDGAYGVFAKSESALDLKFIAANTPITLPVAIQATAGAEDARTSVTPLQLPGKGVVVAERGMAARLSAAGDVAAGTTSSVDPRNVLADVHALKMLLFTPTTLPVHGSIVVKLGGNADANAKAAASVDIGDDGSAEFQQAVDGNPHEQQFSVTITGSLPVKISTQGICRLGNAGRASYSVDLSVEFVPEMPCTFTEYGMGCGPVLKGQDELRGNLHVFTFQQSNGFPSSPGVLFFGVRPIALRIPGTACELLTDPLVVIPFSSDPSGNSVLMFGVRGPLSGDVFMQGVSYRIAPLFHLETSEGLKVSCR